MPVVEYAHISFNAENLPIVSGTRTKVRLIAQDHVYQGWSAEEIHSHYPYLSLGQIHSALAYYYDHKDEMDADIEEGWHEVDRLMGKIEQIQDASGLREKLRREKARRSLPSVLPLNPAS
jgi:uncharacterized protein (DUF433 family)